MQITYIRPLIVGLLLALPQAASAYMCRDENGTTSFQQDPCPERKGTSGVVPVKAEQVTEKAMQETMKRMAKTAFARDPLAAYGLLSRNLKVTVNREDKGKPKVYDFSGYAGVLKGAYDASKVTQSYKCKAAPAPNANGGALACDVSGESLVGGRRIRTVDKQAVEFALEMGEIKITSIETTPVSRSEDGRF
ncbi:MAG: DUF4124 domain-containing protein [Usitatibacter sp.]